MGDGHRLVLTLVILFLQLDAPFPSVDGISCHLCAARQHNCDPYITSMSYGDCNEDTPFKPGKGYDACFIRRLTSKKVIQGCTKITPKTKCEDHYCVCRKDGCNLPDQCECDLGSMPQQISEAKKNVAGRKTVGVVGIPSSLLLVLLAFKKA